MNNTQPHGTLPFVSTFAALFAAGLIACVGNAVASDVDGTRITLIALDGHCDVLTLTVFSFHQAGMSQNCGGSITGVGTGMEGKVTGVRPKDLTIGETYFPDTTASYLYNIQYPLATGRTWSIVKTIDGINFSFVDSGTYTIITADEAPSRAGPPVISAPKK